MTTPWDNFEADQELLDEIKKDRASFDLKAREWTINYGLSNKNLKWLLSKLVGSRFVECSTQWDIITMQDLVPELSKVLKPAHLLH